MEEKLSETREQLVELKTMFNMSQTSNADEHTRIFAKLEVLGNKIDVLSKKEYAREISWKTLIKIGVTTSAIIGFAISLIELLPKLLGVC
jgi:hypothetical protein